MSEIDQKLESLRRGMDFGIANGKANLIVDLVCLDALFKAMDELVKTRKVACDLGFVAQDVIVEERLRIEAALEAMAARAARVGEPAYIADIERRIAALRMGPDERARAAIKAAGKAKGHDDLPMFAGLEP